jgi:hypothetical protein
MLAGQVNQFLALHSADFTYQGTQFNTVTPAGSVDGIGDNGQLAFRFESPSSPTTLGWIAPAAGIDNAGCDVFLTLQTDSGAGPTGNILASCYIPAEWMPGSYPTDVSTWGFPLPYDMTASTFYNIVFSPLSVISGGPPGSLFPSINDFKLLHSTDVTGAYTFNGTAWVGQSYGYAIALYSAAQTSSASTQNLVNVTEDVFNAGNLLGPQLHKNYQYNFDNLIVYAQEWAQKAASGPFNMLCRDDASFGASLGSFSLGPPVNCTVIQATGIALVGGHSMQMQATGSVSSMSVSTLALPDPAGLNEYIAVNYSSSYSAVIAIAPASSLQEISVDISWYTGTPTFISTTVGVPVAQTAIDEFTFAYNVNAIAPINAAIAQLTINVTGSLTGGDNHYVGLVGMFANSNTIWSPPALGISSARTLSYNPADAPVYVY